MKNKKALILGVSGMVGSHLADHLIKKTNWKIYGACRWRSSLENVNHIIPLVNQKKVFFEYLDITEYNSVLKILKKVKPDYIFHLAAQSFPTQSFDEPILTFNTNINGTYNVLDAVKNANLNPIIHICSSSEIFGKVERKNLPIKEDCNFHPASPYAISKVGTDLIAKFFYEAYKLKIVTTRMFTHTGPRRKDFFAESSFAKQIALIENNMIPPVIKVGNLKSLRTFCDVRDAVHAYYLLVKKEKNFGEVYNIGGNYYATIGKMLKFLISISSKKNIKIRIDKKRLRPIDADLQIPNTNKFQKKFKWKPKIKFEKTMTDLLNYWRLKVSKNNFLDR